MTRVKSGGKRSKARKANKSRPADKQPRTRGSNVRARLDSVMIDEGTISRDFSFRRFFLLLFPYLIISASLILVYIEALRYPVFSPEDAYFYALNVGLGFHGLLLRYLDFSGVWYRPTSFYLTYFTMSKFLAWHDIFLYKTVNLVTLAILSYLIYLIVQLISPGEKLGAIVSVLYFASHPIIYAPVFEVTAFDFIYQIFSLCTIIFFILYLRFQKKRLRAMAYGLSLILFIAALTSKELSVALPLFLGLVIFWHNDFEIRKTISKYMGAIIPFFVIDIGYLLIHLSHAARPVDSPYRTSINVGMITTNISHYSMWIFRLFGSDWQVNAFQNWYTNALGISLVGLFGLSLFLFYRVGGKYYKRVLVLLYGWIVIFSLIPIYSGYYTWHISFALIGYSIIFGIVTTMAVKNLFLNKAISTGVLSVLIILLIVAGNSNFYSFVHNGYHSLNYRIDESALETPPIDPSKVSNKSIILIDDKAKIGAWGYGVNTIFNYVYLDPHLKEIIYQGATRQQLLTWLHSPKSYAVKWDNQKDKFIDVTEQYKAIVSRQLQ